MKILKKDLNKGHVGTGLWGAWPIKRPHGAQKERGAVSSAREAVVGCAIRGCGQPRERGDDS